MPLVPSYMTPNWSSYRFMQVAAGLSGLYLLGTQEAVVYCEKDANKDENRSSQVSYRSLCFQGVITDLLKSP